MSDEYILKLRNETTQFLSSLDFIAQNSSQEETLPMFCCAFADILDRIESKIESPKCYNPGIVPSKFLSDRLHSVGDDLFDLVCGSYKSVAFCDEKVPQNMVMLRKQVDSNFNSTHALFLPNVMKSTNKTGFNVYIN